MSNDQVQKAFRFARFIYWVAGAVVAGSLLLWLTVGNNENADAGTASNLLGVIWLSLFAILPLLAFIWIIRFASLASSARELRLTRFLMFALIVAWAMLIAAFIALMAYLVQGLLNFL